MTHPNLREILTVPEAFGKIMDVQDRLLIGGRGTKKVLVGVVTKSLHGTVHIGSVSRNDAEVNLKITLPTLLGAGGSAALHTGATTDVGGTGQLGACFLIFMYAGDHQQEPPNNAGLRLEINQTS